MADTTIPTPITPAAEPAKTPRKRAEQDQRMANDITAALQLLGVATTDPEIRPLLEEKGYDQEELDQGAALQQAAPKVFNARQKAMAKSDAAGGAFDAAEQAARRTYADFRETARIKFSAATDRSALGLTGPVPKDLQKSITTATASHEGAQEAGYAAVLAKAGFKAATLTGELAALKQLGELHTKSTTAEGDAKSATAARDAAYAKMAKWVREYRRLAKMALRGQAGLLAKVTA